jgi:hypothetical protein
MYKLCTSFLQTGNFPTLIYLNTFTGNGAKVRRPLKMFKFIVIYEIII